jgi:hypothetical protein
MRDQLQRGESPLTIASHEVVADHYAVSSVNLAREVAEGILAGRTTWKEFGGTHPKDPGNILAARMVSTLLERGWRGELPTALRNHKMPARLDENSYSQGRFVDPASAEIQRGWRIAVPEWSKIPGSKRRRFTSLPMLVSTAPVGELTLEFQGVAIGAYVIAGPDAAVLEGEIDGRAFGTVDLYHPFSRSLHYPRTVMFATDLAPGKHLLSLRLAAEQRDGRNAARIMRFVVNGPPGQP